MVLVHNLTQCFTGIMSEPDSHIYGSPIFVLNNFEKGGVVDLVKRML